MNKTIVALLSLFFVSVACNQGNLPETKIANREFWISQPLSFSQVQLKGELATRYAAATCNLLTRTDRYSIESFAASASGRPGALWWDWPSDQIGRWLSVLHVAEGYGWSQAPWSRSEVIKTILPLQTDEGNFGPAGSASSDDVRIVSGNAFALRGLMDAYADSQDPRILKAAQKQARYFERVASNWETRRDGKLHEFFGHCIDGLVALYEQGGDDSVLVFAERLAKHFGRPPHTHHTLSLCRGLIDLSRVTEKEEYLEKVEDYLSWCRENQFVTGGLPEAMPVSTQDEGCGLADWVVVNLMMYQATGNQRYVNDAEHTLVNHFFMNQFHTGGFGHLLLTHDIVGGKGWQGWEGKFGSENPGCCSLWGQWALGQVGRFIVTRSDETFFVNLYPSATISLPELDARLEITSDFPRMKKIQIQVLCQNPKHFTLSLRNPPWAIDMQVICDGDLVEKPEPGNYSFLTRTWQNSTIVQIDFAYDLRPVPWPKDQSQKVALFDGPLCIGFSSDVANVDLPWQVLVDSSGKLILDSKGQPHVTEPSGQIPIILEPISDLWLVPDVKDPLRRRVLFQTKVLE